MIYECMVRLVQTLHLSRTDTNAISKSTERRFHTTHITEELHQVIENDFRAHGTLTAKCAPILR
jgi:hypothetical protein